MTAQATFAHSFVLKDKGTALRRVTLEAGFVMAQQADAAALE
jgi:hypothetical protein